MIKKKILRQDSRDHHFHQFGSISDVAVESNFRGSVENIIESPTEVTCTAISTVKIAESKTKAKYDVSKLWAVTIHSEFGADPRETLGAAVKGLFNTVTGVVEKVWAGYYRADTGPLESAWDNVRSAMTFNQSSCTIASNFYANWANINKTEGIVPRGDRVISEHDYVFLDWVVRNGITYALIDFHLGYNVLMPQEVLNTELSKPGCGAYIGSDRIGMLTQTRNLLQWIVDLYVNLIKLNLNRAKITSPVPQKTNDYEQVKEAIMKPIYEWGTPDTARHSVRVICDEEGLNLEQKNSMDATIHAESGYETNITHPNYAFSRITGKKYLSSTDYGICQWNDYWHGKEISPIEAINNPEKAVRLMCAYWKRGQRNQWCAYLNNSYKKYL